MMKNIMVKKFWKVITTPILAILTKFEVFSENLVNYENTGKRSGTILLHRIFPKIFDNFLQNEVLRSLRYFIEVNFLYI